MITSKIFLLASLFESLSLEGTIEKVIDRLKNSKGPDFTPKYNSKVSEHIFPFLQEYQCEATFELSQLYASFLAKATGTGGAFCHCCSARLEDAMNPEIVRHGFLMTRTLENTRAHFNKLVLAGRIGKSNV